ncbi:uncharacterized protein LOC144242711 isoform X2 [Crocuta crocuta]
MLNPLSHPGAPDCQFYRELLWGNLKWAIEVQGSPGPFTLIWEVIPTKRILPIAISSRNRSQDHQLELRGSGWPGEVPRHTCEVLGAGGAPRTGVGTEQPRSRRPQVSSGGDWITTSPLNPNEPKPAEQEDFRTGAPSALTCPCEHEVLPGPAAP